MNVERALERRSYPPLTGIEDFLRFLGVDSLETLSDMGLNSMESLPNIINLGLEINELRKTNTHICTLAVTKNSLALQKGMTIQSSGETREEATLNALFTTWELMTLRSQQSIS